MESHDDLPPPDPMIIVTGPGGLHQFVWPLLIVGAFVWLWLRG